MQANPLPCSVPQHSGLPELRPSSCLLMREGTASPQPGYRPAFSTAPNHHCCCVRPNVQGEGAGGAHALRLVLAAHCQRQDRLSVHHHSERHNSAGASWLHQTPTQLAASCAVGMSPDLHRHNGTAKRVAGPSFRILLKALRSALHPPGCTECHVALTALYHLHQGVSLDAS